MLLKNLLLGATLVTSAAAHPWMARDGEAPALEKKGCPFGFDKMDKRDGESHEELVKRQLLGLGSEDGLLGLGLEETLQNALGGVGGLLEGLLGSVAQLGNGETKVPDENHPFQAPGPTDQRGPCPGLNTLANHGCASFRYGPLRALKFPLTIRHLKERYRHRWRGDPSYCRGIQHGYRSLHLAHLYRHCFRWQH
jgi:hypothetical protein